MAVVEAQIRVAIDRVIHENWSEAFGQVENVVEKGHRES